MHTEARGAVHRGGGEVTRLSNLKPGARFILCRTGDAYTFIAHKRDTPGGTQYAVLKDGAAVPTTLHHSCHVTEIKTP